MEKPKLPTTKSKNPTASRKEIRFYSEQVKNAQVPDHIRKLIVKYSSALKSEFTIQKTEQKTSNSNQN